MAADEDRKRPVAEMRKLHAEAAKLEAEAAKLGAETGKLDAEARRIARATVTDLAKVVLGSFAVVIAALEVAKNLGWLL